MGVADREITRLCDPTCFNKKPDYIGGGQGPSTAEVFSKFGIKLIAGDPSRKLKLRQFHMRLRIPDDPKEMPKLVVYRGCEDFIRTIPLMQADPHDAEEIDTRLEDHCYDSSALICMSRPIGTPVVNQRKRKEWFE